MCPNTQTTLREVWLPLMIWKFAHAYCLHCAVQCHYSFFSFMPDGCCPLLICCGPHNKEQKKALTKRKERNKQKTQQQQTSTNALTFIFFFKFNVAWTLPAYAHAQNCPSRLIMYHLFSLDPIVDLFTNIKCLQANPSCCMFCSLL